MTTGASIPSRSARHLLATLCVGAGMALSAQAADTPAMLGTPMEAAQAFHTIEIRPDTRWVNVQHRQTVRFVVNGQSFGWRFDGYADRSVDLQQIAPPGLLDHPVRAYVAHVGEYTPEPF